MKADEKKVTYAKAWDMNLKAWKIWWKLCPGIFLSALSCAAAKSLSSYTAIYLTARIINELSGNRNPRTLLHWILLQLACSAGLSLLNGIATRWFNCERDSAVHINPRIYMEKMLSLDYADIDRQYVFDLYAQILQNENWSAWGIHYTLHFFELLTNSVIQVIGGIWLSVSLFLIKVPEGSSLTFLNHPLCAAAMTALMLLIAVLSPICLTQGNKFWSRCAPEARLANRIFSFYGDTVARDRKRAADLRMYNQQENVCDAYLKNCVTFTPGSQMAKNAKGPMGLWIALSQCLSVILIGIVYLFVCLKAWSGAFGVGSVTQYIGAITQLFLGLSLLLQTLGLIRINGDFLRSAFEFLELPNHMYQGSLTTEKRSDRQYNVEFCDVSFKYPGSDQWTLRHVNVKFRVGSRLAVVGMNGSGKTTFIKLLCRLYDPTEGQILLNGIDIRKYRYDDYIRLFSVVFQDFRLLAMPLGENVAGSTEYDAARVSECLRHAGFDEHMSAMSKGLDTCLYRDLDETGVEISGGEAQKIAIARALYKDAPFIILDEPTAALDPVAEAEIYGKFNEIVGDKTAIYISHRLSSCKFCDEIAVFHEGAVIQKGTHAQLLADENGKYHELWNAQAQYYTE